MLLSMSQTFGLDTQLESFSMLNVGFYIYDALHFVNVRPLFSMWNPDSALSVLAIPPGLVSRKPGSPALSLHANHG